MATSFRLSSEHMKRLEYLSNRLGKSKAQVVKEAIDKLYDEHSQRSKRSALDRLLEGGFQPLTVKLDFEARDVAAQRRVIRAKISEKSRG
jgi:predicted DNA-binding protein